jgi:hypothetical protein
VYFIGPKIYLTKFLYLFKEDIWPLNPYIKKVKVLKRLGKVREGDGMVLVM